MSEKILLLLLLLFAFLSVQTPKLTHAVIYLGMFSFLCSLVYLFYQSPNVAIAEAVIGSTLATVIYLVALKKQKRFTVYIFHKISHDLIHAIETFCEQQELSLHYIRFKSKQYEDILSHKEYDLLIQGDPKNCLLFSKKRSYKIEALAAYLAKDPKLEIQIQLYEMGEDV
jgi:putative multicomponent Na+:H+ antiporter subunit B